jgi:hypothetical protein
MLRTRNIKIEDVIWDKLKIKAVEKHLQLKEVVTQALEMYIRRCR